MADRSNLPDDVAVDELKRKARRRLVGAVVLALAAAVLVPLLLEKEPRPLGDEVSVQIPPVDEGRFVSKLTGAKPKDPLPSAKADAGKADPKADARPEPAKAPPPAGDAAKSATPADAKVAAAPTSAPSATPAGPAPGAPATPAPRKSLNDAEQRVLAPSSRPAAAAKSAGEPAAPAPPAVPPVAAKAEPAKPEPAKSEVPKPDAANAGAAKAEAPKAAAAKTDGAKAEPAKPAPEPAKVAAKSEPERAAAKPEPAKSPAPVAKPEGFVVQLAAFADDKGANSLANRLKKSGYTAYVEPVETTRGTLWRVRVGGYGTREAATLARDKLKAEGQNGIVAPAR
jgi:DedD protein